MSITRKNISILLGAFVLLLLPNIAFAASAQSEPIMLINAETVENEEWQWDAKSKILTLDGLNLKITNSELAIALPRDEATTIHLKGKNSISYSGKYDTNISAIFGGNIKITGSGSLTININNTRGGAYGLNVSDLAMESGNISIKVSGKNMPTMGIVAENAAKITGGKLSIEAKSDKRHAIGIMAYKSIALDKADLTFNVQSKSSDAAAMVAANWQNPADKAGIECKNSKITIVSKAKYGAKGLLADDIQLIGSTVSMKCTASASSVRKGNYADLGSEAVGLQSTNAMSIQNCQTNIGVKAKKVFAAAIWGQGEITIDGGNTVLSGSTYAAIGNKGIIVKNAELSGGETISYGAQGDGGKLYCFAKKGSSEKLEWKGDTLVGRCTDITIK